MPDIETRTVVRRPVEQDSMTSTTTSAGTISRPKGRLEFECYLHWERAFRRKFWHEWNDVERRVALLYCTETSLKKEMRSWKRQRRESEAEATQGSEVWV